MSSLADRQVCVTGGATCPDWTPLRVSIPRAQHAVSMWMFMEMVHHPPRVHAFCFKQLLVLREVQRQALRISGGSTGKLQTRGFLELEHLCLASSLTEDLTHHRLLPFQLVGLDGLYRIRFPQYKTPASSSALFTS